MDLKIWFKLQPHPNSHQTRSILFHFKWRLFFPGKHLLCVDAYLGAYQQNSLQWLKIQRTNPKLNTSGSINIGVPITPLLLALSEKLNPQLPWAHNEHTNLLLTKRNCCSNYRSGLEWASWVIAPTHRGISALRQYMTTDSYLDVNNLTVKYSFTTLVSGFHSASQVYVHIFSLLRKL